MSRNVKNIDQPVRMGTTSVSGNQDAVDAARTEIGSAERLLLSAAGR